ncbi:TetR/AcrR family transcriptional regulator [Corynebacterium kutscheri]|uniref:TetR/AcrR family transcriptional regulator n=1 Tax=Corynebacterium kutscheri TaxID=35755 RepID=UPI0037BE475B
MSRAPLTTITEETSNVSSDDVLNIALSAFAAGGFSDTKLEHIAKASGMSKRMIHYHFGDKKGLYHRCLALAVNRLRPTLEEMTCNSAHSAVPVEGIRNLVEAVVTIYANNPDAVRILLMENLHNFGKVADGSPLDDTSAVILQLDKLLIQGQDAGAFRPGISALDVFTLIASLSVYRVAARSVNMNLYRTDMMDARNTQGLTRLTVDAVLGFLTSGIKSTKDTSYLSESIPTETPLLDYRDSSYDVSADPFDA